MYGWSANKGLNLFTRNLASPQAALISGLPPCASAMIP
jgi:hypothetical protein